MHAATIATGVSLSRSFPRPRTSRPTLHSPRTGPLRVGRASRTYTFPAMRDNNASDTSYHDPPHPHTKDRGMFNQCGDQMIRRRSMYRREKDLQDFPTQLSRNLRHVPPTHPGKSRSPRLQKILMLVIKATFRLFRRQGGKGSSSHLLHAMVEPWEPHNFQIKHEHSLSS